MIDGTEEQHNIETDYFDQDQPSKKQTSNHMDSDGEEMLPPTLSEQWNVQANDSACTQAAVTIWLLKFTFSVDTDGMLVRISPIDGTTQQYIPTS